MIRKRKMDCFSDTRLTHCFSAFTLPSLTQWCHGVLTLLNLLRHHAADAHQILCDVTGCLSQALFSHLPAEIQKTQFNEITHKLDHCLHAALTGTLLTYRCLTALSPPLRSACFSILSMDSLLARLAFLQTVWLLKKTDRKNKIKRKK